MKYNLQFFADDVETDIDTSVEESEVADPIETEESTDSAEESEESTEEPEETPEEKPIDANAIAAAARRKAEAEAKEYKAKLDSQFARMFGKFKNPETGKPITSAEEYAQAFEAQERQKAEKQLRDNGIDPNLITELVNNNPAVLQAQEYLKEVQRSEAETSLAKDLAEISDIDPTIKSFDDVPADLVQFAIDKNLTLLEAYKIQNFGKMTSKKAEAIRQGAINDARGKAHLSPMNGIATSDNDVEIPAELRGMWEEMFPDKTYAERKKLYNQNL